MAGRPKRRAVIQPTFSSDELLPKNGFAIEDNSSTRNLEAAETVAAAMRIYLQHPAHKRLFGSFDYLRHLGRLSAGPKNAMRVLGGSSAGKSTAFEQYIAIDRKRSLPKEGSKPVIMVKLDRACTTKRLVASILDCYGDQYSESSVESVLRKRLYHCVEAFATDLIFVDEVQHLNYRSSERSDPTDTLKRMLDDGIVSLVFGGDESALQLMNRNIQLANRMIAPGDIHALRFDSADDRAIFRSFVKRLDEELVSIGALKQSSCLTDERTLQCMFVVSSGYLGRVANLVRQSLAIAVRRSAPAIEVHDLALATDRWAIEQKIVSYNPFTKGIPHA